jgi:hypothetical protein
MPGGAHTFRNQSDRREVQDNIAYLVHMTHFDNIEKFAQTRQISPASSLKNVGSKPQGSNKYSKGFVYTQIITTDQIGTDPNDLGLVDYYGEYAFFILNYEKLLAHRAKVSDFHMTLGWEYGAYHLERSYGKNQLAQFMSDLMKSQNKQNEVVFQSSIPLWYYLREIWVPEGKVNAARKLFPGVRVSSPTLIPNRLRSYIELLSQ